MYFAFAVTNAKDATMHRSYLQRAYAVGASEGACAAVATSTHPAAGV